MTTAFREYVGGWRPAAPIHRTIWELLTQRGSGRRSALPAHEIARLAGIRDNAQQTLTRSIIGDMVDAGAPLVGGNRGFHVAGDEGELEMYEDSLTGRCREIGARRDAVRLIRERIRKRETPRH